ncbi:MAG TPA: DUF4157 domain-containing protein [Methylobacter sp.]
MKAAPKQANNDSNRSATEAPQSNWENQSAQIANNSKEAVAQRAFIAGANDNPRMLAQRRRIEGYLGTGQPPISEPAPPASPIPQQQPIQRLEKPGDEEKDALQGKFASEPPTQLERQTTPKPNNTGLPDNLKSGIESLSGMSMDNVKVHYNSSQPAQLNALAYAQGTDIHVAPGQEQHLPHEAWHVVQQAQGRVKPSMQAKGTAINDDQGLEHEADVMGGRAAAQHSLSSIPPPLIASINGREPIQRYTEEEGYKISETKKFAVKNEGQSNSELYVANDVALVELKETKFHTEASNVGPGNIMNKMTVGFSNAMATIAREKDCGQFSKALTGKKEDVENETAPPGRSLFVDNLFWDGKRGRQNWGQHFAAVIVTDGDDRGTLETAFGVDHAWFGIYGKKKGQTFGLKTVIADITLARKTKIIDESTATAFLQAIENYIKTGSTEEKDQHLQKELDRLHRLSTAKPDIDEKFKAKALEEKEHSERVDKIWNAILDSNITVDAAYKAGTDTLGESSFRSYLENDFTQRLKGLRVEQKAIAEPKILGCLGRINQQSGIKDNTGETGWQIVLLLALIVSLIIWFNKNTQK